MSGLQPFLHDHICTLNAPVQLWTDSRGEIAPSALQGLYVGDERIVAGLELSATEHTLEQIGITQEGASRQVIHYVMRRTDFLVDPIVELTRTRDISPEGLLETIAIRSASTETEHISLTLRITPDGSSMEAIKQGNATLATVNPTDDGWTWRDGATVHLTHDGVSATHDEIHWEIELAPYSSTSVELRVLTTVDDAVVGPAPVKQMAAAGAAAAAAVSGELGNLLTRSFADLDSLTMSLRADPENAFFAAGAPWFFTLFGRDSIIAARFALPVNPAIAKTTITALARLQGTKRTPETAEAPGKILHEIRRETLELATEDGKLSLPPLYFGTVDATPLWISLVADYWRATGDHAFVGKLLPNIRAALGWMESCVASSTDGFLRYFDETGRGLANQGWKDSGDSVRWQDGSLAECPIALVEVQAYAYRAALDAAELLDEFRADSSKYWRDWAAQLKLRFSERFWVEDETGKFPAIALDREGAAVDSLTSNIGHLLGSGILTTEETNIVVERLCQPDMFSGFGIRTISTTNGAYWPFRYHVGSVWTHDTAVAIEGLLEDGFTHEAAMIAEGLLRTSTAFDYRLPELFAGHGTDEVETPLPYPASCRPQAWAAASAVVVARALGVTFSY